MTTVPRPGVLTVAAPASLVCAHPRPVHAAAVADAVSARQRRRVVRAVIGRSSRGRVVGWTAMLPVPARAENLTRLPMWGESHIGLRGAWPPSQSRSRA